SHPLSSFLSLFRPPRALHSFPTRRSSDLLPPASWCFISEYPQPPPPWTVGKQVLVTVHSEPVRQGGRRAGTGCRSRHRLPVLVLSRCGLGCLLFLCCLSAAL